MSKVWKTAKQCYLLFVCSKWHMSKGCSNEPPLNTPRGNKVKLYQVQCTNEPLFLWTLSKLIMESLIVKGFKGKDEILGLNRKDRNQYYLCIKSVQKVQKNDTEWYL